MSMIVAPLEAYHSVASDKNDDSNSSFYYDAPQNILNAYIYNEIERQGRVMDEKINLRDLQLPKWRACSNPWASQPFGRNRFSSGSTKA